MKFASWAQQTAGDSIHLDRLNIRSRLTLCFLFIILAMLAGNAILLWQFHQARAQAERLSGIDQELIAILQAHNSLMSFYEKLDALAHSEDTPNLVQQVEAIRSALLAESQRSRNALNRLPGEVQLDATLMPTLVTIQDALPAELDGIVALAKSKDWQAVRLRLAKQVRPLESRSQELVESIDRQVGEQRVRAVANIERAQQRILWIVPITAILTLLFAAFLGFAVTKTITQPLGRLIEGTEALAKGDFGHRVAATGTDEIAKLGGIFNGMVVRLQELYGELQRRETYLEEAQKLSHTGSFGWDVLTGEIYWSRETFRIFGYEPVDKVTIDMVVQRTHPEDRSGVLGLIERVSREREEFNFELRLLMTNGAIKYLHVVGHPSTDARGHFEFVGAVTDATERVQAEEALRRSGEQLAAQGAQLNELFEQAPEGIVLLDVEDRILRANPEFVRMFGYTAEEAIGRPINSLIAPEELRNEAQEFTHRITHGKRVNAETIRKRKDGKRVNVSLLAVPISVRDGQIAEYAIYRDITEYKAVEGELAKQRAHLDELFETVPEGIALVDLQDVVIRVNPEFARIFGYSREEAIGRSLSELVAPAGLRAEAEEFTKRVTGRGETLNVETIRGRKDGSRFPVSILGAPVSIAGSQVAEYAIYRDITERKRAEEELQQLVDFVPQIILVLTPDGKWLHANRVAREYTGLAPDQYRSQDMIPQVIHPDDAEQVRAARARAFSGIRPFELEARVRREDGTYRWFLFRHSPLVEEGKVRRWYASATEIESRKREEERVRRENAILEDRTRIAQELHDTLLQTFLSASMQLGAAMDRLPTDSLVRPKLDQILLLMERGIEEGRNTIQGLRSSDALTADLVLALSAVPQELGLESDVDFRVSVTGLQQPFSPTIRQEVYRIGREALVNTFRHSRAKRVELKLEYADDEVCMTVRDNGCGIDPQVLDNGLAGHWGLLGMRERAAKMGGLFQIVSTNTGTEVRLSVPNSVAFPSQQAS